MGRTARGNNSGVAISLVANNEIEIYNTVSKELKKEMKTDEKVMKDFKFDFGQVDGFR